MSDCVDLQALFGKRYRVTLEADGVTASQWPPEDRVWLQEIRGRAGVVSPYGGDLLQASTDRPIIGRRLRALPFVVHARGDVETVVRFHVDHVEDVFRLIRPRRRRQVRETERQRLRALSAEHGFRRKGANRAYNGDFQRLESTNGTENEAEPRGAA